jgi:hypothetical protein
MKSQARVNAGRTNGTLARGKKSAEARQKCAQNSIKHGLLSKTLVLANEDPEAFESTRKSYYDTWKPENEFEADLVNDMVAARWRLNRIMTIEGETLDLRQGRMDHSGELKEEFELLPEPTRLALAFAKECNESKTLANLSRYEARYTRQLRNAGVDLERIQKNRRAAEAEAQAEAAEEEIPAPKNAILQNEGNAALKSAPKTLKLVRPEPVIEPAPDSPAGNPAPEDPNTCS